MLIKKSPQMWNIFSSMNLWAIIYFIVIN